MIVGLHDMFDAVIHFTHEISSSDRGLSLVLMDGLLLIPVMMAAFFYPVEALGGAAAVAALTLGAIALLRHRGGRR
jgi:hypothetical protein